MEQRKQNTIARIVDDLRVMAKDTRNEKERRIIEREIRRLQTIQKQREQFQHVRQ